MRITTITKKFVTPYNIIFTLYYIYYITILLLFFLRYKKNKVIGYKELKKLEFMRLFSITKAYPKRNLKQGAEIFFIKSGVVFRS